MLKQTVFHDASPGWATFQREKMFIDCNYNFNFILNIIVIYFKCFYIRPLTCIFLSDACRK